MHTCNIDRRGRVARAVTGVLCIALGLLLLANVWELDSAVIRWGGGILLVAGGLFQLYEAAAGWCVMRALGVRTPM